MRYQVWYGPSQPISKSVMYSVQISTHVEQRITRYVEAYRDIFVELYTDTGLWYAEEVIKDEYRKNAKLLKDGILSAINQSMKQEIVWYTPLSEDMRETSIRLGARRIQLTYEEEAVWQIRYIMDIEILRK
jgi:hypothetical protein